jgi:hypothetical protein
VLSSSAIIAFNQAFPSEGDHSIMNDIDDDRDELAFAQLDLPRYFSKPLESPMCRGSSRQSYKINTCFDALVHRSECQAARAMAIKTIQPGMFGSRDEIIYQCAQCGAEMLKFVE